VENNRGRAPLAATLPITAKIGHQSKPTTVPVERRVAAMLV
jgi:hypothetical protein